MDNIASIVTAVGGAAVGVLSTVLGYRKVIKRMKSQAENSHLETFYKSVNEMMKAQEERHASAIARVQEEQREERRIMADERKVWSEERKSLHEKIDRMQEQSLKDMKALHSKDIEFTALRGKMEVLTQQLEKYQSDHAGTIVKTNNLTIQPA